jgi:CRP/FNR family transcriptional regulator, cyclic AMP receptor protein
MSPEPVALSTLREIPFFADLSPAHLELLASLASFREAQNGDELFHEGDPQDCLYIVLEGRVAVEIHIPNHGRLRILTVEPTELLGWSSITDTMPRRTASARAVAATRLLAIDSAALHAACKKDSDLGYFIMNRVANVIANRLLITRLQLLDLFASPSSEAHHG